MNSDRRQVSAHAVIVYKHIDWRLAVCMKAVEVECRFNENGEGIADILIKSFVLFVRLKLAEGGR